MQYIIQLLINIQQKLPFIIQFITFLFIISLIVQLYFIFFQNKSNIYYFIISFYSLQLLHLFIFSLIISFKFKQKQKVNQYQTVLIYSLLILFGIVIEIVVFIIQKLWISYSFTTQNRLCHRNNNLLYAINLIQRFVYYFVLINNTNSINKQTNIRSQQQAKQNDLTRFILSEIYYGVLILLQIIKIRLKFEQQYYINDKSNILDSIGTIFIFILLLNVNVYNYYQSEIIKNNYIILIFIMFLFAIIGFLNYNHYKKNQLCFDTVSQIIQKRQIIKYLQVINRLFKGLKHDALKKNQIQLIILSLKKNHQYQCNKQKCYCKNYNKKIEKDQKQKQKIKTFKKLKTLIKSKNNFDILNGLINMQKVVEKQESNGQIIKDSINTNNSSSNPFRLNIAKPKPKKQQNSYEFFDKVLVSQQFLKQYIKQILFHFEQSTRQQPQTSLKILYFKYQIYKNFFCIYNSLNKFQKIKQYNNLSFRIGKQILQQKIANYIEQQNKIHNKDDINIQIPLNLNNILNQMEKIIFSDIQLKYQKWLYLRKGCCKTQDIQKGILKQIENVKKFQAIYIQNKINFQKSITFNYLTLFYYSEIVFFISQQPKLIFNLKQLKSQRKDKVLKSKKDLEKYCLDEKFCLLEFDLTGYQNEESISALNIKNCNQNVFKVFGYKKKTQFINQNIKKLYPKFLWQAQRKLLKQYLNKQNFKQGGQLQNKYYINKSGQVFQALTSLKIIQKSNKIYLIFLIYQKETQPIMLINSLGYIEGVSQIFHQYWGKIYKDLPFQCLFYDTNQYQQIDFNQKQKKITVQLFNGAKIPNQWKNYIFNIWSFFKKQQSKALVNENKPHIGVQIAKEIIRQMWSRVEGTIQNFLQDQRLELILALKERETYDQTFNFPIIDSLITIKKQKIQTSEFNVIIFHEIKQISEIINQQKLGIQAFKIINHRTKKIQEQIYHQRKVKFNISANQQLKNQNFDQQIGIDTQAFNPEKVGVKKIQQIIIQLSQESQQNQLLALKSSVKFQEATYFHEEFIQTCLQLFQNPSLIEDFRLNLFTGSTILVNFFLIFVLFGSYVFFRLGLFEVKDIFFADGAVSDNMQLTQFMYNRAMNFKQFKDDFQQLKSISTVAFYERNEVFSLQAYDLKNFITAVTFMTSTKFYQYIRYPVIWKQIDGSKTSIQTNQLLQYYYYLSKQVQTDIQSSQPYDLSYSQYCLDLMMINFPQLKQINHGFLKLYQQMSDKSMLLMKQVLIIVGLLYLVLTTIIFLIFYKQQKFRRHQQIQSLSIYNIIPPFMIQKMALHYYGYVQKFKTQKQIREFQSNFSISIFRFDNSITSQLRSNRTTINKEQTIVPFKVWKLLLLLIGINVIFLQMLLQIKSLFEPIQRMMLNVNNLMDSQNYLIQSYVDLKSKFIIQQNFKVPLQFFDQILSTQKSSQVTFNKIAIDSLQLFSKYDKTYKIDFIQLLINNTCQLAKQKIALQQYTQCINNLTYNFLQNGVITGMNFFTREVRNKIQQLKSKFIQYEKTGITESNKEQILQLLKSPSLRQIDQSMLYMFRMYQATQARIYTSLQTVILEKSFKFLIITLFQFLIMGILYHIFLYFNYKQQKIELSKIYISFIMIPTPISKMITSFATRISEILEYRIG